MIWDSRGKSLKIPPLPPNVVFATTQSSIIEPIPIVSGMRCATSRRCARHCEMDLEQPGAADIFTEASLLGLVA